MKVKKLTVLLICLSFLSISLCSQESEKKTRFGFGIGYAGSPAEYWNGGPQLIGSIFSSINQKYFIGLNIIYNEFTPNENELLQKFNYPEYDINVSGSGSYLEVTPALRFYPNINDDLSVFLQGGAGLCFLKLNAKVELNYLWYHYEESIGDSTNKPCVLVGAGLSKGKTIRFEIAGLFYVIFSNTTIKYYSGNLGIFF